MKDPAQLSDLEGIFSNLVQAILGLAGITFFVLLLVGGLKYITSGGDPKATEGAQKTLTYAVGGLIAIVLSYLILVLIKTLTGVDVTKFTVFQP
jgi:hypothetical protein